MVHCVAGLGHLDIFQRVFAYLHLLGARQQKASPRSLDIQNAERLAVPPITILLATLASSTSQPRTEAKDCTRVGRSSASLRVDLGLASFLSAGPQLSPVSSFVFPVAQALF